jgi:hypothetical protein
MPADALSESRQPSSADSSRLGAMHTTAYAVVAIDAAAAQMLRGRGGISYVADSEHGYPCRQCLRDAEIGDELILVSHDPFDTDSPYRCASPVFLHRTPCAPHEPSSQLPEQLTSRRLSVRAFDDAAMMRDGDVIDGSSLDACIARMLADPAVAFLHVHNAGRGCLAARIERRATTPTTG